MDPKLTTSKNGECLRSVSHLTFVALLALTGSETLTAQGSSSFVENFDARGAVAPFDSSRWDVVVHSRARQTWLQLEPMLAAHALDGSPPPATHPISSYADAVYTARDHLMTAINSETYGLIYLTPNAMADWSQGECVVRFDVSTLRTSRRDWIDLWLTPWEDNMILPLEESLPDLQGNPRRGLQLRMSTWRTVFQGSEVDWSHFEALRYDDHAETRIPFSVEGIEKLTTPSARQRQTLELRISRTRIRFGMPDYNFWWVDEQIADLGYDRAVVQFGHHSYNPLKPGTVAPIAHDTALAGTADPSANSWHWDAFEIAPATRFDVIKADRRYVLGSAPETVRFDRPAPEGARLRFAAVGDAEVSFDGGPFVTARRQDGSREVNASHEDGFFASFWMPIPEGTQSVDVRLTARGLWAFHRHETMAKNFAIWSLSVGGTGCAGAAATVPRASHPQPLWGDPSFGLDLSAARPAAQALLFLSLGEVETSGCGIGVALDRLLAAVPRQVDAVGGARVALPLPPVVPALAGLDLYAQWAVLDVAGEFGGVPGVPLALTPLRRILPQ